MDTHHLGWQGKNLFVAHQISRPRVFFSRKDKSFAKKKKKSEQEINRADGVLPGPELHSVALGQTCCLPLSFPLLQEEWHTHC